MNCRYHVHVRQPVVHLGSQQVVSLGTSPLSRHENNILWLTDERVWEYCG